MAKPTLVGYSSPATSAGANLTFSATVSGTNRLLLVSVQTGDGEEATSCTFNGVSLTRLTAADYVGGVQFNVSRWYLVAPPVGTYTVAILTDATPSFRVGAIAECWNGVDQTTPFGTTVNDTDLGVTGTTSSDQILSSFAAARDGTGAWSATGTAPHTIGGQVVNGAHFRDFAAGYQTGTGSLTASYSLSGTLSQSHITATPINGIVAVGPQFDSVSTSSAMPDTSTTTWSHTVGAGSNRVLLVGVRARSFGGTIAVSTLTYGGVPMTFHQSMNANLSGGSWFQIEVWKMVDPPVGTANVVLIAASSYDDACAVALSFTGVDQTTPIEATNDAVESTAVALASADITTLTANAMVVSFVYSRAASGTFAGTGTQRDNVGLTFEATDFVASATQLVASPSAITQSWTNVANDTSVGLAVSLKGFIAAAGNTPAFGRYRIAGARR